MGRETSYLGATSAAAPSDFLTLRIRGPVLQNFVCANAGRLGVAHTKMRRAHIAPLTECRAALQRKKMANFGWLVR